MCIHLMCCRYVVCKGYLDVDRNVSHYLLDVNDRLNEMKGSEEDVLEVRRSSSVAPLYTCTCVCCSYESSLALLFTTVWHRLFQSVILLYEHTHVLHMYMITVCT